MPSMRQIMDDIDGIMASMTVDDAREMLNGRPVEANGNG